MEPSISDVESEVDEGDDASEPPLVLLRPPEAPAVLVTVQQTPQLPLPGPPPAPPPIVSKAVKITPSPVLSPRVVALATVMWIRQNVPDLCLIAGDHIDPESRTSVLGASLTTAADPLRGGETVRAGQPGGAVPLNLSPEEFAQDTIEEQFLQCIENEGIRYVAFLISVPDEHATHANLLVLDKSSGLVQRFEPNGSTVPVNDKVDEAYALFFQRPFFRQNGVREYMAPEGNGTLRLIAATTTRAVNVFSGPAKLASELVSHMPFPNALGAQIAFTNMLLTRGRAT